jgi:hypothetical protein
VKDLDRQVFPALPKYFLVLLAQHLACSVVWVNDVVADLELDVWRRFYRLEILEVLFD